MEYPISNTEYPISNAEYPAPSNQRCTETLMEKRSTFDLEERLIDYAVRVIAVAESLPNTKAGQHVSGQLLRSGTSPASNYGEAQSAESRDDFIHKVKIALKELRESFVWLKIIVRTGMIKPAEKLSPLLIETDELISILFVSVSTAKRNLNGHA